MATRIQIRGGTAAQWTTANPILSEREMGIETDTRKFKFGDGATAWNTLAYASAESSEVVQSVTGEYVNNTDPTNPVIEGIDDAIQAAIDSRVPLSIEEETVIDTNNFGFSILNENNVGLHIEDDYLSGGNYKSALWSPNPEVGNGVAVGVGDQDGSGDGTYAGVFFGDATREATMAAASPDGQSMEFNMTAGEGNFFTLTVDDNRDVKRGIEVSFSDYSGLTDNSYTPKAYVDELLDEKVDKEDFEVLTYASTVDWDTDNAQNPLAKLTATGSFTLNMTNVKSGASGVFKLITNTASSITITFDSDFTNKSGNSTFTAFSFPAETAKEYYVSFIVDGTTIEWNFPIAFQSEIKLLAGDILTTSNVQQNITGFSWTLLPNSTYRVNGVMKIGCNNTGGVTFSLTAPALASCYVHVNGRTTSTTAILFNAISVPGTATSAYNTVNSAAGQVWMDGLIVTGANGGTLQMTFASATSTQQSTVFQAGSVLKLEKI